MFQNNHKMKKYLILLYALTTAVLTANAYDFSAVCETGQTLYYSKVQYTTDLKVTVVCPAENWDGFEKPAGDLVFPTTVYHNDTAYTVSAVNSYAFMNCTNLYSISIPSTIIYIGSQVFTNTGWYNNQADGILYLDGFCLGYKGEAPTGPLTIANGTRQIADEAFYSCDGITSLNLPNTLIEIGNSAIYNCRGITGHLIIPNSVIYIDSYTFSSCTGITSVTIPNSVTTLGWYAFEECTGLKSVTIPNSVVDLGQKIFDCCTGLESAFIHCSRINIDIFKGCSGLKSVYFGSSVTSITGIFRDFPELEEIIIDPDNPIYDSRDNCNAIIQTEGNILKVGCKGTLIPKSIEKIGQSAFEGCSGLTGTFRIPNSITEIGDKAFYNCSSMSGVIISNSVTSLGNGVFMNCTELAEIIIGSSVTSLNSWVFKNCSSLNKIICLAQAPPLCINHSFDGANCSNLIVCCGCKDEYEASSWGGYITNIEEDCNNYSIILESNYSGISVSSNTALMGAEVSVIYNPYMSLESLVVYNADDESQSFPVYGNSFIMPNYDIKITAIFNLFNDNNLSYILNDENSTATLVGHGTVDRHLNIPDVVTKDGIEYTVTAIEDNVFNGCDGIITLTIGKNIVRIGQNAFSGCNNISVLRYNCQAKVYNFITRTNLTKLEIGNDVQSIDAEAFYGCSSLTNVVIGNGMTTIGDEAFKDCSNIKGITSYAVVAPMVGPDTFSGIRRSITITIPEGSLNSYLERWSYFIKFVEEPIIGVEENSATITTIYPNPTSGIVKITAEGIKNISIFNVLGEKMFESAASGNDFEYDFSDKASGIYLIKIETDKGIDAKRVEKI